MKIYSLLAIFGFFLGAVSSEISPDETAEPVDTAPVVVEGEETTETSAPRGRGRGRRNRRERNTDSDDDTDDEPSRPSPPTDDSDEM